MQHRQIELEKAILDNGRRGEYERIFFAAALLTLPDGSLRISYVCEEAGDKQGIGFVEDFVQTVKASRLLKKGESIRTTIFEVTGKAEVSQDTVLACTATS